MEVLMKTFVDRLLYLAALSQLLVRMEMLLNVAQELNSVSMELLMNIFVALRLLNTNMSTVTVFHTIMEVLSFIILTHTNIMPLITIM